VGHDRVGGGLGTTFPSNGPHKFGSIGIALPHVEARIADVADPSKTMPRGEVGELMMRGPIVMQGYYGNETATRETIEPNGWLHTDDLASMDQDGAIFIVDRRKDMINTGGFKVFPAEIERVVAAHPGVASRTSASVLSVIMPGMTSGRGNADDQSGRGTRYSYGNATVSKQLVP